MEEFARRINSGSSYIPATGGADRGTAGSNGRRVLPKSARLRSTRNSRTVYGNETTSIPTP